MSEAEALAAYLSAATAVVEALGVEHQEAQAYLIQTRRYLDGYIPAGDGNPTELKMRNALSQRIQSLTS